MKIAIQTAAKAGRPREFDQDAALVAAMRVFWEKGYEGASLADLTAAMGINRPSLYAAFGDKEELFRKALERYGKGPGSYLKDALNLPTARAVIEALLRGAVHLLSDPRNPHGCFSVQGALVCGTGAEPARDAVRAWRKQSEAELRRRFERAKAERDLPANLDAGDLARYVATVLNGLGVQAANGAGKAQMMRVAEMALRAIDFESR